MTDRLGLPLNDVKVVKDEFLKLLTEDEKSEFDLGKLKVFEGVKQYPIRVKCAALVWRALEDALENTSNENKISTE